MTEKAQQEEEQSREWGGGRDFAERKASLSFKIVCVCMCVGLYSCTLIHVSQKPEESVRSPGVRVTGDGGSNDMGAGTQMLVLSYC